MSGKKGFKQFTSNFHDFVKAAFDMKDKSTSYLKKEAYDAQDNFMLLCLGDLLGLPIPTSYYTIEILPYIAEDLEGWEKRMLQRQKIWQEKWAEFEWCC